MDHAQKNEKIKQLKSDIEDADDACDSLLAHLGSSKFRCGNELDGYISINDVREYVLLIKENL